MYQKILVALDNSPTDQAMIAAHPRAGAGARCAAVLLHVADGWAARHYDRFQLADSEEMTEDRAYLERAADGSAGAQEWTVETELALGEPATGILRTAAEKDAI